MDWTLREVRPGPARPDCGQPAPSSIWKGAWEVLAGMAGGLTSRAAAGGEVRRKGRLDNGWRQWAAEKPPSLKWGALSHRDVAPVPDHSGEGCHHHKQQGV